LNACKDNNMQIIHSTRMWFAGHSVKGQVSVLLYLCVSWEHLILIMQHNTTRWHSQNRKFAPILTITDGKRFIFLSANKWVCQSDSDVWSLCKNYSGSSLRSLTVIRVECFGEKHTTRFQWSRSVSQLDSNRIRFTYSRDSSRVIDSNHAITGYYCEHNNHELGKGTRTTKVTSIL